MNRCSFHVSLGGIRSLLVVTALLLTLGSITEAGDRSLWSAQLGGGRTIEFKRESPGLWREYQNGRPAFSFEERGENDQFVVLYDPPRNHWVRLYADRCDVMAASSQSDFRTYYRGNWVVRQKAPPANDGRKHWYAEPAHGRKVEFKMESQGKWREFQNDQPFFSFEERGRNTSCVTLHDPSRNHWVRLYEERCDVMAASSQSAFQTYYRGSWNYERGIWP